MARERCDDFPNPRYACVDFPPSTWTCFELVDTYEPPVLICCGCFPLANAGTITVKTSARTIKSMISFLMAVTSKYSSYIYTRDTADGYRKDMHFMDISKKGAILYLEVGFMPQDLTCMQLAHQQSVTETLSFTDIVDRYRGDLYRICYLRLGNREESEDAVQEIFLRVYRSFNTFKPGKELWPWMYTIAVNYLRTHYARLRRLDTLQERATLNYQQHQEDPTELIEQREMQEEVRYAFQTLPPKLKKVVKLYYMDNMSILDISEILGISRENVKVRLHRARNSLRELLGYAEKRVLIKRQWQPFNA